VIFIGIILPRGNVCYKHLSNKEAAIRKYFTKTVRWPGEGGESVSVRKVKVIRQTGIAAGVFIISRVLELLLPSAAC